MAPRSPILIATLSLVLGCGEVKSTATDAGGDGASSSDAPTDGPSGPPQFSSCVGLAATCGAQSNANCCATGSVPGGTFRRSYDVAADAAFADMSFPATVSAFRLDTYEVTVGRFRKFVNAGFATQAKPPGAGAGAHPNLAGSGWNSAWNPFLAPDTASLAGALKCNATFQSWTDTPGNNENVPINCITWYEAMAFCIWDGGYLPTEAEWNYAAAGGDEQRAYPWSSPAGATTVDCSYANYRINNPVGTACTNGSTGAVNRVGSESPKGDGRWGQADLAGNVFELLLDSYAATMPTPCTDCAEITGGNRVVRGGSFGDAQASYLRVANRFSATVTGRSHFNGVRCARSQ